MEFQSKKCVCVHIHICIYVAREIERVIPYCVCIHVDTMIDI